MTCAGCDDCTFVNLDVPVDHHEIHITVMPQDAERFPEVCRKHGIKPILVHTEHRDGTVQIEAMTSHKFRGTYEQAIAEAETIIHRLILGHVVPVRCKIETSPSDAARSDHPGGYWEAHLELSVPNTSVPGFRQWAQDGRNLYVSRNVAKTTDSHTGFMLTLRGHDMDRSKFLDKVNDYIIYLLRQGLDIGKRMIEYCWHDSNPEHDSAWMIQ